LALGDPCLNVVGRRVEVLADVGHQAGGKISQGPVIVHLETLGNRNAMKFDGMTNQGPYPQHFIFF
jgi:hypothetical protein